jgi:hypothetical protein
LTAPLVRWCVAAAAALLASAPLGAEPVNDFNDFKMWSATNDTAAFLAFLADRQVLGVVPTRELVRTASDWRNCGGPQFEVPPRDKWGEVHQVLKLVRELQQQRILVRFEAVSNYRNPKLNACAGGAKRSSHARGFAVDVVPVEVDQQRLCAFWQRYGKYWKMGLSRYPSGRIHLDTSGWRSWGASHGKATAFCR